MANRRHGWLLIGLVALGFGLRVVGLDFQSLWRDEVDALLFAAEPLEELLHTFVEPGQNGPFYFLLLRPWLEAAGTSEFALRFFSVIFGVLTVPLLYRLGRQLFPSQRRTALLAALLVTTSPYLVWYGQEGKMYTLVTFLIVLSMERYLTALSQGGWQRWLAYVAATSLAFYAHLLCVLIIPAQVLIFLMACRRDWRTCWKPWLASLFALTVPYVPLLAWQIPMLLEPAETGFRFVPLHQVLFSLMSTYSLGVIHSPEPWALAVFMALLLVAGLLLFAGGRDRRSVWVLALWLLVPVLVLFGLSHIRPIYTARYLIFVLPAYLLLLACAVVVVSKRSRLIALLAVVMLLALNGWGIVVQARTPFKADFRGATNYVSGKIEPGDLVVFQIPHGRYSFEYYFQPQVQHPAIPRVEGEYRALLPAVSGGGDGPYRWAEGLYTNSGMSQSEVADRMARLIDGSSVVWLVATEVPLWDEEYLVQGWLDEQAQMTNRGDFVRVTVYRYELEHQDP